MSSSREHSMAKRSDFAQKLLDDLRARKELLGASQNSNNRNSTAADKYAYSSRGFSGSQEMKTRNTGSRRENTQRGFNGGNLSLTSHQTSNQLVPFGQGQTSQKIDLSSALAFALENAGKATRVDPSGTSIISFLHQIGRRSMDYGKIERSGVERHRPSSSHVPTIHLHIKEISKGTQKLNQIIKACKNGLTFDRHSMEYGKELMQGAIDLERSLRMLVEIQEASEYMVSPQRKNRIKLLDEDEDDDNNSVKRNEQKQLETPRFSFDDTSRNYHGIQEVARADIKMRLAALTYSTETRINHENQTLKDSRGSYHRRSKSCSADVNGFSKFSEHNNKSSSSQPKADKGRIPNVIAKLMGLGEIPEDADSKHKQRDSTLKTKIEEAISSKTVSSGTKKIDHRRKDSDLASQNIKQTQANKVAALENLVALQTGKNLASRSIILDVVIRDETQAVKDMNSKTRSQKDIWEKERDLGDTHHKKMKNPEKSETEELKFNDESQRMRPLMHRQHEVMVQFQEEMEHEANKTRAESNHTKQLFLRSQRKPQNILQFDQSLLHQKSEHQETKHEAEERKHSGEKHELQLEKQKGDASIANRLAKPLSDSIEVKKKLSRTKKAAANGKSSPVVNDALQTKRSPKSTNKKCKVSSGSHGFAQVNMKDSSDKCSNKVFSPKERESESERADNPSGTEEKPVHIRGVQKTKERKPHSKEIFGKINEVATGQSGSSCNLTSPLKRRSPSVREAKDGRQEEMLSSSKETNHIKMSRSNAAETCTVKSKSTVSDTQRTNINVEQAQSLKQMQTPAPVNSCQAVISVDKNDQQAPESVSVSNEVIKSNEIITMTQNGTKQGGVEVSLASLEQQKLSKPGALDSLTETENHLKKILVKSQLFLDTAEALFRLNIPFGILHVDGHDYHPEDSNLILDCGHEIMKRKGRRKELSVHPFVKVQISCTEIKSLDDLVRQLNKDIRKLKSYRRDGMIEAGADDYLAKMLETDVHFHDPDLNCMWDLGWNDTMSTFIEKDDVIRDVERSLVNGLIEEITRDLLIGV